MWWPTRGSPGRNERGRADERRGAVFAVTADPDDHRCEALTNEAGEVIAVVHMAPGAPPETRAALVELVKAAKRRFEADPAADPTIGERQAEAVERVRARARRLGYGEGGAS